MNKTIFEISFITIIVFISQFESSDAGFIDFLDKWIFGSFTSAKLIYKNIDAEKKFIDDEATRIARPNVLRKELYTLKSEIATRSGYYRETNFIMRIFVGWILKYLDMKRIRLEMELERILSEEDLEPLCHHRFHEHDKEETDSICIRAFQNSFFDKTKWELRSADTNRNHCSSITISKIDDNNITIAYGREARECFAKTIDGEIKFNFYLIAGPNYLRNRRRLEYYVLLNKDTRLGEMKKDRYWKIASSKTTTIEVAAFIG